MIVLSSERNSVALITKLGFIPMAWALSARLMPLLSRDIYRINAIMKLKFDGGAPMSLLVNRLFSRGLERTWGTTVAITQGFNSEHGYNLFKITTGDWTVMGLSFIALAISLTAGRRNTPAEP